MAKRACGDVPANCPHDGKFVDRVLDELKWLRTQVDRLNTRMLIGCLTLMGSLIAALGAVVLQLLNKSG
jgi:hypothetical protein